MTHAHHFNWRPLLIGLGLVLFCAAAWLAASQVLISVFHQIARIP